MPKALAPAETQTLLAEYAALRAQHGSQSPEVVAVRNRIVEGNLGLAFDIWRKGYSQRVPYEDVLGIGAQGLMKAIERFDCSRGLRFSTYAVHWIRHALGRTYQNEATIVRVPVHAQGSKKAGQCRTAADAARRMCSLDATLDPWPRSRAGSGF
jgi:DNA-directed RNA polymerase sigma subunit (sigma70/sigma32)